MTIESIYLLDEGLLKVASEFLADLSSRNEESIHHLDGKENRSIMTKSGFPHEDKYISKEADCLYMIYLLIGISSSLPTF
jgi:hypothetical protein